MKIANTDDLVKQIAPDKTSNRQSTAKADFGEVLKETLNTSAVAQQSVPSASVVESLLPAQIQHLSALDKKVAVDRIETVLDLLDDYRRKLADPDFNLKDIHPTISAIENENQHLKPMLNSMIDGDELKQILNQTLITTSVEVIKFNKGDYITT
jgi:hypothetical protein